MKKKHLKSLNTIEKWLNDSNAGSDSTTSAFEILKKAISSVPETDEIDENSPLPPPLEISTEPMTIAVYSDGGCRGNPGPGACAFVIQRHDGKVIGEGVEYEGLTTNNKMELSGALKGLEEVCEILPSLNTDPLLTKVKVMTDSKYVVDGMKTWVQGWKARGWKKADNKVPENLELWQALDKIRNNFMQVEWMWVKGHAGHPQNEYCDRKANELMDKNS
ncbi:MAG TPA: ribonuclease H [Bacteriovoracaceae bacterium]|nr:ribonuclease H [Bacteriovoracaceae bacterium]